MSQIKTKSLIGRPPKYRKDYHPENFILLSEQGKCLAQIARIWRVDRDTIYEWGKVHKEFSDAIKKGRQVCEAWYMDLGQASMIGQAMIDGVRVPMNNTMFVWMTKNLFKWSDKVEMKTPPAEEPEEDSEEFKIRLAEKIKRFQSLDE